MAQPPAMLGPAVGRHHVLAALLGSGNLLWRPMMKWSHVPHDGNMRFDQHYLQLASGKGVQPLSAIVFNGGAGWAWVQLFSPATSTRSAEGRVRFNGTRSVIEPKCCEYHCHDHWRESSIVNPLSIHCQWDSYTHDSFGFQLY